MILADVSMQFRGLHLANRVPDFGRYAEKHWELLALGFPVLLCYSWTGISEVAQIVFVTKCMVEAPQTYFP
jgi:hypothetical protein